MNKDRAIELLKAIKEEDDIKYCNYQERYYKAIDIAIESLEHQVNEKDEIKLVCPKCKREWIKPIGEFCSSCGTEMVVEPYERKE